MKSHDFLESYIGRHNYAISALENNSLHNFLVSSSWDSNLKLWDQRVCIDETTETAVIQSTDRIYCLSCYSSSIVVATADQLISYWDVRFYKEPIYFVESSLKQHTRSLVAIPETMGHIIGSSEGTIGIDYHEILKAKNFKQKSILAHSQNLDQETWCYAVNKLRLHPLMKTFASCGTDGYINFWNLENIELIYSIKCSLMGVYNIDFNSVGDLIVASCSFSDFDSSSNQKALKTNNGFISVHKLDQKRINK
ncbi:MAG: mitotic spindle checkpoint protein Bub3 [Paramarteilia canceri]